MEFAALLAEESGLIQSEVSIVLLLSLAALVAIVIRRIRFPYTVALVLVGLFLSFFPNPLQFDVSSDLILAILVPPLLFEATLQIKWEKLRKDLVPILLLGRARHAIEHHHRRRNHHLGIGYPLAGSAGLWRIDFGN